MTSCLPRRAGPTCGVLLTLVGCANSGQANGLPRDDADESEQEGEAGSELEIEAGEGVDAGSDGGETAKDDRLQPFEVGRRWSYTRVLLDASRDGGCEAPLESHVAGTVQRDGQSGWDYRPTCGDAGYQMFIDGDDIWAYSGAGASRTEYAKAPVQEGFEWPLTIGGGTGTGYAWQEQGSIEVPAGTFERCWRRVLVGSTDGFIVLCRGVGLVVTHSVSQNYRLELSEKNF